MTDEKKDGPMAGMEAWNRMTLAYYQREAAVTANYPQIRDESSESWPIYPALKLSGEAGEVAEKIGKALRDGVPMREARPGLKAELGDVLWYVAMMARDLGYDLEDIAQSNLDKLASRVLRGKIGGSGDDR